MSDAGLRDRLVALERARNVIEAEQAKVMVELHGRAAATDAARDAALAPEARALIPAHDARLVEFVADEIAVLLASTRMLASHRLDAALDIARHDAVCKTWATGSIDARKAAVIATGVRDVDPVFADVVAAQASEYAMTHTAPQTRAWLARRVMTADPGAAEIRRARASEGRRVSLTPLADGMAELSALLPGIQARQAYDTLNALAHRSSDGGPPPRDSQTMDQRRADALIDLLTGRAEPPQVNILMIVPADTLAGEADLPGIVPGLGPITAQQSRRLAGGPGQTSYRALVVDPETGTMLAPAAAAPTCSSPSAAPATRAAQPSGAATAARATGVALRSSVAPASASQPGYRPSAGLDRDVRARDLTCRFPGCRRRATGSASGTDLDHSVPGPLVPPPGQTWSHCVDIIIDSSTQPAGWPTSPPTALSRGPTQPDVATAPAPGTTPTRPTPASDGH